jgi:hypothetical protein
MALVSLAHENPRHPRKAHNLRPTSETDCELKPPILIDLVQEAAMMALLRIRLPIASRLDLSRQTASFVDIIKQFMSA